MVVLIATHPKPRHLDDYLAVSLLLWKYPDSRVVTVRNLRELERVVEELKPEKVIVVDVGGRLGEGSVGGVPAVFYDHHQSIDLPCSLILVLKGEFPDLYEKAMNVPRLRKLLEYIDYRDRFGVKAADERFGIVDPVGLEMLLIPTMLTEPSREVGENFSNLVNAYFEASRKTKVFTIDDVRVALTTVDPRKVPMNVVFEVSGADILIAPNTRNPRQTSVIKNQFSPLYPRIDLSKLREAYEVVFLHPNGFLAVVNKPIESFTKEDIERIVHLCLQTAKLGS